MLQDVIKSINGELKALKEFPLEGTLAEQAIGAEKIVAAAALRQANSMILGLAEKLLFMALETTEEGEEGMLASSNVNVGSSPATAKSSDSFIGTIGWLLMLSCFAFILFRGAEYYLAITKPGCGAYESISNNDEETALLGVDFTRVEDKMNSFAEGLYGSYNARPV